MNTKSVIPQANPAASYTVHRAAVDQDVQRVLDSGWYIHGEQCAAFEAEFAAWLGLPGAMGVGNGTDALEIALRALKVGPGDEVITIAYTAVATVAR